MFREVAITLVALAAFDYFLSGWQVRPFHRNGDAIDVAFSVLMDRPDPQTFRLGPADADAWQSPELHGAWQVAPATANQAG
jgi:hypothetical protein